MPDIPTSCRSWSFELNKQRRASRQATTHKAQGNREPGPRGEIGIGSERILSPALSQDSQWAKIYGLYMYV